VAAEAPEAAPNLTRTKGPCKPWFDIGSIP
jgi:hypothetical protein